MGKQGTVLLFPSFLSNKQGDGNNRTGPFFMHKDILYYKILVD